jgi:hypothetical protein
MYDPAPCRPYIAAAMNQLAGVPPPRGHPQRILASVAVPASRFPAAFLKRFVSLFLGVGRQVPRYTRLERPSAPIFFYSARALRKEMMPRRVVTLLLCEYEFTLRSRRG